MEDRELEVEIEKKRQRALEGSRKKIEIEKLSDIFEHLENNIPKKCLTDLMEQISETYMIRKNES